ncbi:HAD family hydrolase [Streptomyces sp. NEAU-174]|uniref:HAD family hydrolase n=1 Tax=Streptomyces sp. NEAU-174 TaxID=3458254 RepID=UPI00404408CD
MDLEEVVWDMDGTLLDSSQVVPAAFVRAVRALGGPEVDLHEVVAAYWRGTPEVILEYLVGRKLSRLETEAYYRELDEVRVAPYPGVMPTLQALRRNGRAVAVFTGASSRAAAVLLKTAGLRVDLLIGGDHILNPKPAADGLLLATEQLRTEPQRVVYVGDSPLDLRAAAKARCHGAAAAWGHMYDPDELADTTLAAPQDVLKLLSVRPKSRRPR